MSALELKNDIILKLFKGYIDKIGKYALRYVFDLNTVLELMVKNDPKFTAEMKSIIQDIINVVEIEDIAPAQQGYDYKGLDEVGKLAYQKQKSEELFNKLNKYELLLKANKLMNQLQDSAEEKFSGLVKQWVKGELEKYIKANDRLYLLYSGKDTRDKFIESVVNRAFINVVREYKIVDEFNSTVKYPTEVYFSLRSESSYRLKFDEFTNNFSKDCKSRAIDLANESALNVTMEKGKGELVSEIYFKIYGFAGTSTGEDILRRICSKTFDGVTANRLGDKYVVYGNMDLSQIVNESSTIFAYKGIEGNDIIFDLRSIQCIQSAIFSAINVFSSGTKSYVRDVFVLINSHQRDVLDGLKNTLKGVTVINESDSFMFTNFKQHHRWVFE